MKIRYRYFTTVTFLLSLKLAIDDRYMASSLLYIKWSHGGIVNGQLKTAMRSIYLFFQSLARRPRFHGYLEIGTDILK